MPPRAKKNKNNKKKKVMTPAPTVETPVVSTLPAVKAAIDSVVASHALDMQSIVHSTQPGTHNEELSVDRKNAKDPSFAQELPTPLDKTDGSAAQTPSFPTAMVNPNPDTPVLPLKTPGPSTLSQHLPKLESATASPSSLPPKSSADIPKPAPAYVPHNQQPVPLPKSDAPQPLPKDKKKKCIIL